MNKRATNSRNNMRTFIFLMIASLSLGSCSEQSALGKDELEIQVRNSVKKDAKLELPATIKLVEYASGGQVVDPSWAAKLSVPSEEVDVLASKILAMDKKARMSGGLTKSLNWWNPGRIVAQGAFEVGPEGLFVRAILSEENNKYFLYFEDQQ